jgi:hypothetical protein
VSEKPDIVSIRPLATEIEIAVIALGLDRLWPNIHFNRAVVRQVDWRFSGRSSSWDVGPFD